MKNTTALREVGNEDFTADDWRRFLTHIGEDPARQGLLDTPARVEKAWRHWTSGYGQDPAEILKVFEDGAEQYNELIVVRGIPVYSHCEHHLAPFFGTATIGYTPDGRIVGLSKLTRLVDCFARRLQVQERMTMQIAEALMTHVQPLSVGVVVRCRHMCMESRGIQTPGEETVTSALLGEMRTNLGLRSEFLALARETK
jgi:GTP cyclohydrolase I